jgi:hypothetical protein
MNDSQDQMNRELRFKTTAEERKIIRDRLNKFTTLKRGVAMTSLQSKSDDNGSSAGLIPFKRTVLDNSPIFSCRTSLNHKLTTGGKND